MSYQELPKYIHSITRLMDLSLSLHHINKTLEAKCGLSVVQWSLLKTLLDMPAVSPLMLSKALGVTPGTLSQTLARLDKKKYLFMCDDPTDARKKMISITRLGRDVLASIDQEYERIFSEIDSIKNHVEKIHSYLNDSVKHRLLKSQTEAKEDTYKREDLDFLTVQDKI